MNRGHLSLPVLAILGAMLILGHDVLMAADPHGQATTHDTEHHPPEVECHVPEGALPASVDAPDHLAAITGAPADLSAFDADRGKRLRCTPEPSHPPDTLRALLQVFLN